MKYHTALHIAFLDHPNEKKNRILLSILSFYRILSAASYHFILRTLYFLLRDNAVRNGPHTATKLCDVVHDQLPKQCLKSLHLKFKRVPALEIGETAMAVYRNANSTKSIVIPPILRNEANTKAGNPSHWL